jgi:hypothetical protein
MSFLKSPYFPAVVCCIVIAIVMFMLFRDVSNIKGTMSDLVEQHNNAQKALEVHGGAIKRLQEVEMVDYDDDDEEDYDHVPSMPTIKEEIVPEPISGKRSKST